MEVAVSQPTSRTSQRLSTHNPVTSTSLYCCRRSRTAFWMWTTCSSRDAGLPVQPWWPTTAIPTESWCSTEMFTRLRIDWTELLFLASERIRLGPASVTESTKSALNRFCRYWITGSWTRPSMQFMAVQNLMVSANWWGAGRFVFAQRVEGLRQALCSHPQSVTPPLRGVGDDTGAPRCRYAQAVGSRMADVACPVA